MPSFLVPYLFKVWGSADEVKKDSSMEQDVLHLYSLVEWKGLNMGLVQGFLIFKHLAFFNIWVLKLSLV